MEMTVPLVDRGNGRWGSPSPAWDHLINRESSGNPTIIQQIHDVNSGGNEAEGLFQITPKTWDRHGGRDFAPSARHATPQQQAIVAARIFTRNPTGSDWGAGRPGREDPRELAAGLVPLNAPAPAREPYGMPTGSNSGGYGGGGGRFPDWVYRLGDAFGVKPSTYPGHQESDRNETGYAPNPAHLNRGIDWSGSVDAMQRFADYLFSIRGELEQVIWWNPQTNQRVGVAGGRDVTATPYYDYPGGYDDHRDHVHTRQSHSLPSPGAPAAVPLRPPFTELDFMTGGGRGVRTRPPINFLIHTEEGDSSAEQLARYCDGSHNVSYHYTLRDGILCDVVDTDYYSWSVLAANVFTINLCFAGSRAGWSRDQWMLRERDIDIAAYIAVQDCRKYNIPAVVIAPPYHESPGISDHKYVTQQLGIGNHTDVGNQFPWDVFARYVTKYANPTLGEEGFLMALSDAQQRELYEAVCGRRPSLSALRPPGDTRTYTMRDMVDLADGSVHFLAAALAAKLGHPDTLALLEQDAAGLGQYPDRRGDALLATAILADFAAPAADESSFSAAPVSPPVDSRQLADAYAENARLREENARLREENARLQQPVSQELLPAVNGARTSGDRVAQLIDSVEDWTELALSMDVKQRAALAASIKVLQIQQTGDQQ